MGPRRLHRPYRQWTDPARSGFLDRRPAPLARVRSVSVLVFVENPSGLRIVERREGFATKTIRPRSDPVGGVPSCVSEGTVLLAECFIDIRTVNAETRADKDFSLSVLFFS